MVFGSCIACVLLSLIVGCRPPSQLVSSSPTKEILYLPCRVGWCVFLTLSLLARVHPADSLAGSQTSEGIGTCVCVCARVCRWAESI